MNLAGQVIHRPPAWEFNVSSYGGSTYQDSGGKVMLGGYIEGGPLDGGYIRHWLAPAASSWTCADTLYFFSTPPCRDLHFAIVGEPVIPVVMG